MEYPKMLNVRVTEEIHDKLVLLASLRECFVSDIVRQMIKTRLIEE
jgi:predicted HicB family RNase H-like nuclease